MESSPYLPGPPGSRSKLFAELIVKMGTGVTSVGATAASGEPLAGVGAGIGVDLVLRLLEDLSWRQIVSLSYFMDDDRQSDRAFVAAGGSKGVRQVRPVLEAELADLMEVHGLIGFITSDGSVTKSSAVMAGGPIIAASLDKIGPSGFGRTLYRLSEMEREIKAEDLDEFVRTEIL